MRYLGVRRFRDRTLSQLSFSSITAIRFASQTRGGPVDARTFCGKDEGGMEARSLVLFTTIIIIIIIRHRVPPAETREILNAV